MKDNGRDSHAEGTWAERIAVFVVLRMVYFVIGCILGAIPFGRSWYYHHLNPWLYLLIPVVGVLSAIFGPSIYTRASQRGRGSIREIRAQSRTRLRGGAEDQ